MQRDENAGENDGISERAIEHHMMQDPEPGRGGPQAVAEPQEE